VLFILYLVGVVISFAEAWWIIQDQFTIKKLKDENKKEKELRLQANESAEHWRSAHEELIEKIRIKGVKTYDDSNGA
jgi:hypothetical protein